MILDNLFSTLTWILVIVSILLNAWNNYLAGKMYRTAKTDFAKLAATAGAFVGTAGILYALLLIGIMYGYVSQGYLIGTQLILGIPLISAGVIAVISGWQRTLKEGKWWQWFFSILQSIAVVFNIFSWIRSFRIAQKIGFGNLFKSDNKKNNVLFYLGAIIAAALIGYGFFKLGEGSLK